MATKLLKCLICPKRPDFSDTSHLLTHVSSKGHLSHLHKLQVRSHQEVAAGNQLVIYNQWYQEHGMGQLLSERMLHKESKETTKRQAPIKRESKEEDQRIILSNNLFESPIVVKRTTKQAKRVKKEPSSDGESEYISSPIRPARKRTNRINLISPIKRPFSIDELPELPSSEGYPSIDPNIPVTPESSKLKGIVWPGMALFDAANHDERRKRNQKKDASVLRRMEKTSELIEPWEVIYDAGGAILKERFITGEVDSSSPLRGETPIPKPKAQKKRQPLARINSNMPRSSKRNTKSAKPRTMAEVRKEVSKSRLSRSYVPVSSPEDLFESTPGYSPTEDENMEFKLTVGNMSARKTKPTFTIFNDREETAVRENLSCFGGMAPNPFNMNVTANPVYPARPQFPFITAPWLQPQNQQPQPLEYNNPYMSHGTYPDTQPLQRPAMAKQERFQSQTSVMVRPSDSPIRTDWRYRGVPDHTQLPMQQTANNHFCGGFAAQEDPFGYSKNPLNAAFSQMASSSQPHPTVHDSRISSMEKPISPDGTISDPDRENDKTYEQALFATSE